MKTNNLSFKDYSIIITVGPSNCGKSYFVNNVLATKLKELAGDTEVSVISSDEIRRSLVNCPGQHKHSDRLWNVSSQAFTILETELEARTSYPVNNKFVIIDSTALDKQYRSKLIEIAKKNNYNIYALIFNYKNKDDYFRFLDADTSRVVIEKHVKKLKENLKDFTLKDFRKKYTINSIDFDISVEIEDSGARIYNIGTDDYYVIGDIHGDYNSFIKLLEKIGKLSEGKFTDKKVVLIGDYIDKVDFSLQKKVVDLIYENKSQFIILRGNHENFVIKYWENGSNLDKDFINTHFNSCFIEDEEFKKKVREIWDISYDIVKGSNSICTHSPCSKRYLGKTDSVSLKQQRNTRHTVPDLKEAFSFLNDGDQYCHPIHIWGHIPFSKVFKNKSNIGIDTGAYLGNKLTAVYVDKRTLYSVESELPKRLKELSVLEFSNIDLQKIDPRDKRYINNLIKNNVNYISGTMCPADILEDDLESLEWALFYYKNKGIEKVCLQPKKMGSRLQVYLKSAPEECYGITRRGFKFKDNEKLYPEYQRLIDRFKEDFDGGLKLRILDCEVLPWRLLGESLIDKTFFGYHEMAEKELVAAEDLGFSDILLKIREGFNNEVNILSKKDFISKYGHHTYKTMKGVQQIEGFYGNKDEQKNGLSVFKEQAELYGSDGPIKIEPFSILKDVFDDREYIYKDNSNSEVYKKVSDLECLEISLEKDSFLEDARAFYEKVCENNEEGVVVKPDKIFNSGIAPYLKVRNKNYLHIVYGPDYLINKKYNKLLKRKRISSKLRKSISMWELGFSMLETAYNNLGSSDSYKNLLIKLIGLSKDLEKDDPRL